ncbi:MAG: hypothetical protein J0L92_05125 [Deltaproteobacteria bacterium]|nr:hypothetical protein [Deltaproteobacteria bacterium]
MRTTILLTSTLLTLLTGLSPVLAQDRELRFESDAPTLVSVEVGSHAAWQTYQAGGYTYRALGTEADHHDLCFTPCAARLPSRVLRLEVYREGVGRFWLRPIDPPDGSTLRVRIRNVRDVSTAGMVIFLLGWPVAGALAAAVPLGNGWAAGVDTSGVQMFDDTWEQALWISSGATLLLSWFLGCSLWFQHSSAELEVIPGGVRF